MENGQLDHEHADVPDFGGIPDDSQLNSMEQVNQCWNEYLGFGEYSVFRLCCDLDRFSMQHILELFQRKVQQQGSQMPLGNSEVDHDTNGEVSEQTVSKLKGRYVDCVEELELDLCAFRDDESLILLTKWMRDMSRLRHVEVENRILETPWNSWTVSLFLEKGGLHRLEKLVLYGVDLCGETIGKSFQHLFTTTTAPNSEMKLTELMICFCRLDRLMLEHFCTGLHRNSHIKKLTLYEGSIDDDMLQILVDQALSNSYSGLKSTSMHRNNMSHSTLGSTRRCLLHSLNLGRNQLTSDSLQNLVQLLIEQPHLEFLSLSHNIELFRGGDDANHELSTKVQPPTYDDERQDGESYNNDNKQCTNLGLTRRKSPQAMFWSALYQHTRLLNFWAQSPASDPVAAAAGESTTLPEQRAESILLRNKWLKRVTSSLDLPFSLWPRALMACSCHNPRNPIHQSTLVFAFLRYRIEAWLTTVYQKPRGDATLLKKTKRS